MNDVRKLFGFLSKDRSWKAYAIVMGIALAMLVVMESVLFVLAVALLKLLLVVVAIAAAAKSLYLAWPAIERRFKESNI